MKHPLTVIFLGISCFPLIAKADTLQLISTANSNPSHCLGSNTSSYVAAFDGKNFEVFTVLANCDDMGGLPERCASKVIYPTSAPIELTRSLKGVDFQLIRHLVPIQEVLGIRFDDTLSSACPAGNGNFRKKTGPLKQPASLEPIQDFEFRLHYGSRLDIPFASSTVINEDWTEWLRESQSIKTGDIIPFNTRTVSFDARPHTHTVASNSSNKADYVLLAGKRASVGATEEIVVIEGELMGIKPNYTGIQVASVFQSNLNRAVASNSQSSKIQPLATLNPARVFIKTSSAGGFNWEAELNSNNILKLRLLKIRSDTVRTIEVEAPKSASNPILLRSVRRTN